MTPEQFIAEHSGEMSNSRLAAAVSTPQKRWTEGKHFHTACVKQYISELEMVMKL